MLGADREALHPITLGNISPRNSTLTLLSIRKESSVNEHGPDSFSAEISPASSSGGPTGLTNGSHHLVSTPA